MGAMVSRDGTNSSFSNTKTNYSFTNEKKRQRGGGKKKTLTTEKTIVSAAAQASKSNDNDVNEDDDELLKTPTKKKTKKTTNNVKHERAPPKNWEECLAKIKAMRKNGPLAPVDTMGWENRWDERRKTEAIPDVDLRHALQTKTNQSRSGDE